MSATPPPAWSLHPQLANDTTGIGDLPLARTLLMNDASYPWLVLVPRQAGVVEIIVLDDDQQTQLMSEIAMLARVLKDVTGCHKLNIAAIGNVVSQLHVHIVARRRTDASWPRPVWGAVPARAYGLGECERFIATLRRELRIG